VKENCSGNVPAKTSLGFDAGRLNKTDGEFASIGAALFVTEPENSARAPKSVVLNGAFRMQRCKFPDGWVTEADLSPNAKEVP